MILFFKILFKEFYHLLRSHRSWAFLYLVWRISGQPRYKALRTRFGGQRWHIPDALSFVWQVKEIMVEESYAFACAHETPLIYDCGANVGLDCAYFKKKYPKAHIKAFEADPYIATLLAENIRQNQLQNIDIQAKAVWIHDEGILLAQEGADGGSIFGEKNRIQVPSIRLKNLLAAETKQIDMLKMDIEGAESAVLADCQEELHKVQNLFVEYHSYHQAPQKLEDLLQVLARVGFRYYIEQVLSRKSPLLHHRYKNNEQMDLQLNIFAYRPHNIP